MSNAEFNSHSSVLLLYFCSIAKFGNVKDKEKDISIHTIPFSDELRPEAKKFKQRWIQFVQSTMDKLHLKPRFVVCSVCFSADNFSVR